MYRILKLKQIDSGVGPTQINSTTLLQGPGLNVNITGTTITDALNYILEAANQQTVSKLTISDKQVTGCTTTNDSMINNLSITYKPTPDARIDLRINGVVYSVGQTTNDSVYFSNDGGLTSLSFDDLAGGESLYWKFTEFGFNIESSDRLDLDYGVDDVVYTSGATMGVHTIDFEFTGDNTTQIFNFPHTYGYNLPKMFTSYALISGEYELFEFEEIKFTNNNIQVIFSVAPTTSESYKFIVTY